MSEQSFPFGTPGGGVGVAEPPAPEVEETEAKTRRPLYWVVGGAVLLVVALAGYFLLFNGGGSTDTATTASVPMGTPSASASASTAPSAAPSTIPATATGTTGRDPFKPLVVPPAASPAAAAPSAAPSTSTGTSTGLPPAPATGGPSTFSVVSIDSVKGQATTLVDGKKYVATVGQTFATYFKLVAVNVSSPCGVFQYGDASMNLCAKDTVSLN